MAEHTRGPWRVAQISSTNAHIEFPERGGSLAICFSGNGIGRRQMVSNANLIAAAPDLLEACEAMLANYGSIYGSDMDIPVKKARAAIAKARGE